MGYFTIHLPGTKKGDVRYGPIKKMKKFSHRFRRKNFEDEQIAYIVKVDAGLINERAYYLIKKPGGQWLNEMGDEGATLIKNAIDCYENQMVNDCGKMHFIGMRRNAVAV